MAAVETAAAVSCRSVSKDFGDGTQMLRVLHDIDIQFNAGQLSLLVGPSGCGKTTLISIIAGILSTTAGEVDVFGQRVTSLRGDALSAFRLKNVGFIFQQYNLLPSLSAAENAAVPLAAAGVKRKVAVARAKELLARLDLSAHVDKLPNQLSGGQQQRVAIARALVNEPRLVVCDEPTAALDARAGHRVMELLREVAVSPDRACITVTHDNRIFDLADRIVTMEDGRITPSNLVLSGEHS
jgi:putative ABC transport system ATP-binding protein